MSKVDILVVRADGSANGRVNQAKAGSRRSVRGGHEEFGIEKIRQADEDGEAVEGREAGSVRKIVQIRDKVDEEQWQHPPIPLHVWQDPGQRKFFSHNFPNQNSNNLDPAHSKMLKLG